MTRYLKRALLAILACFTVLPWYPPWLMARLPSIHSHPPSSLARANEYSRASSTFNHPFHSATKCSVRFLSAFFRFLSSMRSATMLFSSSPFSTSSGAVPLFLTDANA